MPEYDPYPRQDHSQNPPDRGWNQSTGPQGTPGTPRDPQQEEFFRRYQSVFQEPQPQQVFVPQSPYYQTPLPPQRPKKEKRRGRGNGTMAVLVVLCMILSGLSGFAGGYGASLYFEQNREPVSSVSPPSASPLSSDDTQNAPNITEVARIAAPSVVEISTETVTTNPFLGQNVSAGAGSGVIISEDGYIVTNHHVIESASKITVRLPNGSSYSAALIGSDADADIALLKIDASGLPAAVLGDSDALQVGDFALAIGNPLGELGGTVTDGIISALSRPVTVDSRSMTLLQTNAAINAGNSGGGLFNRKGELIGIVNAKSMGSGIEGLGFAIPINNVKSIIDDLMNYGYVTGRPYLGITPIDINDARTAMNHQVQYLGVYVAAVEPGSAAENAGLLVGDCILTVGGQQIATSEQLASLIGSHSVGDEVEIQVLRDGTNHDLTAILQERTFAS